ncbi:CoA transferase [Novosphingobium sp. G106]|uniref:CoA transferase n=1 Tax=Novosphingobium sp. G106 TaxID=2849500 RepID=UPI0020C4DF1C|nr:CoA transferase [Novosphingobium sp. G106]
MSGVFAGVRVIELAQYVYVPGAAVMMADQGAEVIKIETIDGDPYRTLQVGMSRNLGNINIAMEQNNRNKKSVALDLKTEEGREALLKLVETADVFLTSIRPKAITALRLDVEDLRARNPKIIYARGNGVGFRGAEANRPGFDGSCFWARGGAGYAFTRPGQQLTSPRPAYGDHTGSLAIAYGIASALFKRAMTGGALGGRELAAGDGLLGAVGRRHHDAAAELPDPSQAADPPPADLRLHHAR